MACTPQIYVEEGLRLAEYIRKGIVENTKEGLTAYAEKSLSGIEACSTLKMWNIPELFTIAENPLLLVLLFVLPLLTSKACRLLDFSFQKKQVGNSAC